MAFDLKPEPGDDADLPEDGAPAAAEGEGATETPAAEGPQQVVSLKPAESRRARAARELNERIEGLTKNVEALTSGISQRDQQLAQMRGFMEAQAMQPRYQAPPQQAPMANPAELVQRARKALVAGDHDTYHELTLEAAEIRSLQRMAPALQELQQRAQPANQMPPEMAAMFAAYPDVAMHPRHVDYLQAKNLELNARGVPPGPDRLRMIFAEVDSSIKGSKRSGGGAQFSPGSAAALSGVPTSRSAAGGASDGPGITLTAVEAEVAARLEKQGVMTKAQYAKGLADADPSRVRQ